MSNHPQIPDDVAALISAYALGVLEPDQAELAERHIASSDACRRAFEDALETSAALALCVADSEPSGALRDRIVAAARAERPQAAPAVAPARAPRATAPGIRERLGRLLTPSGGFALAGIAAAIVFALVAVTQHNSASDARDRQAALVSLLASSDARVVPLKAADGSASGRVIVADGRAALISSLGAAPSGRTYQAWGLPADGGKPVPLPTFSGKGAVVLLDDVGAYAKVAVTVEPSGGSQAPSQAPFAAAAL
jgi:anti-sigma-K factor RskA